MVSQIAATGPVAAIMLLVLIVLYRAYNAKESCKDPSAVNPDLPPRAHPPCNRCLACKDRLITEANERIHNAIGRLEVALSDIGEKHTEAVKEQERSHSEEVDKERARNDQLANRNEATLRELLGIFKDSPGPEANPPAE